MAHNRDDQERGRRGRHRGYEDPDERNRARESQREQRPRHERYEEWERPSYLTQEPPYHESELERGQRRFEPFGEPFGDRFRDRFGDRFGRRSEPQRRFQQPYPQFDDPFGGRRDAFGDYGPERREPRHEWWRQMGPAESEWQRERREQGRFAGRGPKGYRRSDERVLEDVNQALEDAADIDASEIEVTCQNGEVVLRGSVCDRRAKRMAEDVIEGMPGVKDVRNELRVTQMQTQGESREGESSWSPSGAQGGQRQRKPNE